MVVVGFGAAGRAGKASAPVGARWLGRGLFNVLLLLPLVLVVLGWAAEPVLHEGPDDDPPREAEDEGSDGKAEDAVGGGGRIAGDEVHPAEAAARYPDAGVGPPRRVLFLSLRTLFECFWEGAPPGWAGLAAEALAQPLELDVAPCMPLRPGRLG